MARTAGLEAPAAPPPARPNTHCPYAVFDPLDHPATPTPLHLGAWTTLLSSYPDATFRDNVLGIIRHGAKLGYSGPLSHQDRPAAMVRNHPLDADGLAHVRRTVADRVASGRSRPAQAGESVVVSPLGTVPKANGKRRTINDLSWPRRRPSSPSVNAGINREDVTLQYDNLDRIFALIRLHGARIALWKADLKDAFFHVSVASADARLLGFHIDGVTYKDCTLNFGGRSSPFLFNLVAEALHWILESFGLECTHYLDDSFGSSDPAVAPAVLAFFKATCEALGVSVSEDKTSHGPALELLGINFDCRTSRAWISEPKLERLRSQIDALLLQGRASRLELQSLAGYLNFVARVCPPGRAFLRRIYDAIQPALSRYDGVTVGGGLAAELSWWRGLLDRWDGVAIIPQNLPRIEIWTDAATTRGLGAHLGPREACTDALSLPVPQRHRGKDILFLETLAVLEALRKWGPQLAGREVMLKVDNAALAACLRSGACDQRATQSLIREIFALALELHFTTLADWVPSKVNDVADALSRFDWPYLLAHRPHVPPLLPAPDLSPIPRPTTTPPAPAPTLPNASPPCDYGPIRVGGDSLAAFYLWYGIAGSTRAGYDTVVHSYATFARQHGWLGAILPATSPLVEAWIAHEAYQLAAAKGLSKKSLKRKLSALASWHTDLGMPKDGIINERVERIVAGANRFHGMTSRPQPLPITLPVLRALVGAIRRHPDAFGGDACAAALTACFTLAFACFMRMGELTYDVFDPRFDLRRDSVACPASGEWRITIPASKADAFRQGVTVVIPEGLDDTCPRRALRHWFSACPEPDHAPLFSFARMPFTRTRVISYLNRALTNCGFASALFSGHSFRRGAATWASSIGMSATDIKTLGRWNSECYRLYIDAGPQRSASIGRDLLTTPQSRSTLPASGIPEPGDVWRPSLV